MIMTIALQISRSPIRVQANQIFMRNRLSIEMSAVTTSTKKLPFNQTAFHRLRKKRGFKSRGLLKRRLTGLRSFLRKLLTI